MDELARIVRRPITLEDASGRLLAYSVHEYPVDQVRIETLLRRGASSATIRALSERGVYKYIDASAGIAYVPAIPEMGFGPRAAMAVRKAGQVLGYLWIALGSEHLSPVEEQTLLEANRALADAILGDRGENPGRAFSTDALRARLVSDLVSGKAASAGGLQARSKSVGWRLTPPFQVMVVQLTSHESRPESMTQLMSRLEGLDPLLRAWIAWSRGDSQVTIILSGGRIDGAEFARKLLLDCESLPLQCGVGAPAFEIPEIAKSYSEACAALKLGPQFSGDRCFEYTALAVYEMVSCFPLCKKTGLFGREQVEKVLEYDRIRGQRLFETLEVFLDLYGNRKAAAKRLHIHPNTLDYRMNKIRELMKVDLNDPNVRLAVHVWTKAIAVCRYRANSETAGDGGVHSSTNAV